MGRIDEAIRRGKSGGEKHDETAAGQASFVSAWSVRSGERTTEPTGPALLPEQANGSALEEIREGGALRIASSWRERLAIGPDGDPVLIEQFRRVAATLHQAHQSQGLSSVMVTSASPGEGKTLTAINLALVLAESYRYRVLLVDADLRRPSIASVVDLSEGSGLSEALKAPTPQKLALVRLTSHLTLLPAGRPTMNSIEALISPRMRQIIDEALTKFDWVILDAPPVGASADARLLSQLAGGTLFVIRAAKSQHDDVAKAIDGIGRDQILGVILNDVEKGPIDSYYYYGVQTAD